MDDKERELLSIVNENGNEESHSNPEEESSQSNSGDEDSQSDSHDEDSQSDPEEESSQSDSDDEDSQSDSDDEDSQSDSDDEDSQSDSDDEDSQSDSDDEDSQSNTDDSNKKMQFMLSIDKGYTSAAKSTLFRIDRDRNKMSTDTVHSSLAGTTGIFEEGLRMLTSDSFLRTIEKEDMKAATKFLKSSWTYHARRYEASRVKLIDRKFPLNIYNNLSFAERAIQFAAKNRNAKAFSLITSALFLKAVKTGDKCSVKRFLNGSRNERSIRFEALCMKSFNRNRKTIVNVDAFDMDNLIGCCISFSDWLEGIALSPRLMLIELFKFEKIVDLVTKHGWTVLHLALFQLQYQFDKRQITILMRLLEFMSFDLNALRDEMEILLYFTLRCSVPVERFSPFMRELLKHKVNVKPRNSFTNNALMIAGETVNIAAMCEIEKWKDSYSGEIADISSRDEDRQNDPSFTKHSKITEIVAMIEQNLFLRAVENGDIEAIETYLTPDESNFEVLYRRAETDVLIGTVKTYLTAKESDFEDLHHLEHYKPTDNHEHNYEEMEIQSWDDRPNLIQKSPRKRLEEEIAAPRFTLKASITRSVWLEAVAIAQYKCHGEMLNLLYNDDRFIHGFDEDGQTILHQVVAQYFATKNDRRELRTIEILLTSGKFSANILNLQNETIFEIVCKIEPKRYSQLDDLLRILLRNGIDLNERNKSGETFLMHACKNKRVDIVRSLLDLDSPEFVLDIDAIDNSGETALMKAKERDFYEIVFALSRFKLISAVTHENADIVKSMHFDFFNNTSESCVKSWNSITCHDMMNENEQKYEIWRDAMFIAMKKQSEDILKHLWDCDMFSCQEGTSRFHQLIRGKDDEMRLIELLLKSGKIDVNARNDRGMTALHWVEEEKVTSLLIGYGADVNKKDNKGTTPLIEASRGTSAQGLSALRTMLEKAETLLDAVDCNGRTALVNAVMESQPYAAELLLEAGASVNLSDHLGFTALHYALYRDNNDHAEFPRNYKELNKRNEMAILFDAGESHEHCERFGNNKEWSEERMKIVEILLRRLDIDVNALSFEKFSPLDMAVGSIPQSPSSIINALKKKGAVLNAFQQRELQPASEFYLDIRCKLMLIHLVAFSTDVEDLDFLKRRFVALIKTFKEQIVSGKDPQGRTALHLVAISFSKFKCGNYKSEYSDRLVDLSNAIVRELITLGCSVNETDIFGRTPLHYANNITKHMLKSYGADASIKDKDGNIATDEAQMMADLRSSDKILEALGSLNKETYFLRLLNNKQMQVNVQYVDTQSEHSNSASEFWQKEVDLRTTPRLLWEECEYAFRHPSVEQITKEVMDLMVATSKEVQRLDPRFESKPVLVGGSNEGTKTEYPDEFDFCVVLTKISELCEVSQSPELSTGFVRIKRKPREVGEGNDFDDLFTEDGMLNTEKLNWQFTTIFLNAMVNTENKENFVWNLELPILNISYNFEKVLNIGLHNAMNFASFNFISIDVVPCIHVDGWWPDEAIFNVSDKIRDSGCNLVFDRPHKLYPWVPYSEFCARISFSKAESDTIKQSCVKAKEAYMIGKTMIEKSDSSSKYILKNSLLYCIEALTPTCERASQLGWSLEEMESKFHQMDRYLWLRCLLKCHLEFVSQNFCSCYFLPKFSSPIEGSLKNSFLYCITGRESGFLDLYKKAYAFYRWTSNDTSQSTYQMAAPDPLWEHFDRNQLIASLCGVAYK